MLSLSSYHTAIIQTGAAMFSIATPAVAPAFYPVFEVPVAQPAKMLRAVNDNAGKLANGASDHGQSLVALDEDHSEALFKALMGSSIEVSGPFLID